MTCNKTLKYITMWFNRHTADRNYSGEQKVNFESPVPFSKCLRDKSYSNMNVHFDPQGCQTLLLKESEPFLLSLGSWTKISFSRSDNFLHTCLGHTKQVHDIKMASMRRHDVTYTSIRRHFNIMRLQGSNAVFVL